MPSPPPANAVKGDSTAEAPPVESSTSEEISSSDGGGVGRRRTAGLDGTGAILPGGNK